MNNQTQKNEVMTLSSMALSGVDVKRTFDQNYLDILHRMHDGLPMRYLVDFLHKAQLSGADPRLNQIHLTSYFSNKLGHKIGVTVFSYHFFLNQANQTGEMEGLEVFTEVESVFDPIKCEEKQMLVSTAKVKRKGRGETSFKARWSEFFNPLNPMWKDKPYIMLEKSAIANVLRWAFPESLSGMFIDEEIGEDHIKQAEDNTWKENAIEATGNKLEFEKKTVELIKDGHSRDETFNQIKVLVDDCTKGMKAIEKGTWISDVLNVRSISEIKGMDLVQQNNILQKLIKKSERSIAIEVEKPKLNNSTVEELIEEPMCYIFDFGQFKGKKLSEVDPSELKKYSEFLKKKAIEDKKELQGKVLLAVNSIDNHISFLDIPFN